MNIKCASNVGNIYKEMNIATIIQPYDTHSQVYIEEKYVGATYRIRTVYLHNLCGLLCLPYTIYAFLYSTRHTPVYLPCRYMRLYACTLSSDIDW